MLKIIGILLIVLAGIGAGLYASTALNRRVANLERFDRLVCYISTQIRYTAAPIQHILSKAVSGGEFAGLPFLKETSERLLQGQRPDEAFKQVIYKGSEDCRLSVSDRELLLEFGQGLGKSDIDGQLSHCETFKRYVEDRLQTARNEALTKGKLYITLGVAGGLGLALLLL